MSRSLVCTALHNSSVQKDEADVCKFEDEGREGGEEKKKKRVAWHHKRKLQQVN